MSNGINVVHLIGNLGADPETKFTQGGTAVTSMSVATTSTRKDKQGNKIEETQWHSVKAFGRLAEVCGEYLRKGSKVYIEGSIRYRTVDGNDGQKRYFTDIVTNEMRMLDGKREDGGQRTQRTSAPARQAPAQTVNQQMDADFADDDIPF